MYGSSSGIDWIELASYAKYDFFDFYASTPALLRLNQWDAQLPVAALHLLKAHRPVIENMQIVTIGDFINSARKGVHLKTIRSLGAHKISIILDTLKYLSKSIDAVGNIDWFLYAKRRNIKIYKLNPDHPFIGLSKIFATIHKNDTVLKKCIVQSRVLAPQAERKTLEEIGTMFGITRERVRQVEENLVSAWTSALLDSNYSLVKYRFSPFFDDTLRQLSQSIRSSGTAIWRLSDWVNLLTPQIGLSQDDLLKEIHIWTTLLEFEFLTEPADDGERLLWDSRSDVNQRKLLMQAKWFIPKALRSINQPLTAEELLEKIKVEERIHLTLDDLHNAVNIGPRHCVTADGHYMITDPSQLTLNERIIRYFRALTEPKAIHYSEVFEHLFPNKEDRPPYMGLLNFHGELVPVGSSGKWALKEWGVETRSVHIVAYDLLEKAAAPMHIDDLADQILELRYFKRDTLYTLLRQNPDLFKKNKEGLWESVPRSSSSNL